MRKSSLVAAAAAAVAVLAFAVQVQYRGGALGISSTRLGVSEAFAGEGNNGDNEAAQEQSDNAQQGSGETLEASNDGPQGPTLVTIGNANGSYSITVTGAGQKSVGVAMQNISRDIGPSMTVSGGGLTFNNGNRQ